MKTLLRGVVSRIHIRTAICFISSVILASIACPDRSVAAANRNSPEVGAYSIYHFKQERPLRLDLTRVAVMRSKDIAPNAALPASLSRHGLDVSSAKSMAIRDWSLVATTAANRTGKAIEHALGQIASTEPVEFVSPVFLGADTDPIIVTPYILVGFDRKLDPARAQAILAETAAGWIVDSDWANMQAVYRLKAASRNGFEVLAAANQLAQIPDVTFAEPDVLITGHVDLIPNDPYFQYQWALRNDGTFPPGCTLTGFDMDATKAWDITLGDPSIIVVILDEGVQLDHPDLNLYTPGIDTTSGGGDGSPVNACDNHGTPVAGCISGVIDNNLGAVGVAPGVRSASARFAIANLDCAGGFTTTASYLINALTWAESIGARITNSSFHLDFQSAAIDQKYLDTRAAGMIHFAAAGNFAQNTINYPASLPSVNAVAALEPCGGRAAFSNYGVGLAFSAPGHYGISADRTGNAGSNDGVDDGACLPGESLGCNIDADCGVNETCFTVSEDYGLFAGTSMASPYTAGVAALVLSIAPNLSVEKVESILRQSAVDLGSPGYDTDYGWGFVNAAAAVRLARTSIPAVSDWGLVVMIVSLTILATLTLAARRSWAGSSHK